MRHVFWIVLYTLYLPYNWLFYYNFDIQKSNYDENIINLNKIFNDGF